MKYAEEWYDKHIKNETTFLYIYFANEHETDDSAPGYMAYTAGKQAKSVMDSEAVEIFWTYLDRYWYDDMDTSSMFVETFTQTGDTIMTRSATTKDILKYVLPTIGVIIILILIVVIIRKKREAEAERAAETERILNTPLEKAGDDLLNKYSGDSGPPDDPIS